MSTPVSRSDDRGFTLAEVLIALAVLAVVGITATALLAQLTTANVDGRDEVLRHATAVAVMESLLVQDYADLDVGASSGTSGTGIDWTTTISDESAGLRRLTVAVTSDGRSVVLETLRADR